MKAKVKELTDQEFKTIVNSVKTMISEKDKNLNDEFRRFYDNELLTHAYQFDRQEK